MFAGTMKGRLILDCSILLPGPFTGKLLAERGARVLKVENPDRPDPAREMGAGYYDDLNSLKELVWLNITQPEGRARFHELVRQADGLIEAYRPQAKAKLGLDAATLHAVNPRLAIVSLVGYPEDGPRREHAGHDLNFQAATGALQLGREMPALPLADLLGGYSGALAMLSEIDAVQRGQPGRRVVVSLSEAIRHAQSKLFSEFRITRQEPVFGETLMTGKYPCYRIYRAGDGRRVAVGAIEAKFWEKTCQILGVPELASKRLSTGPEAEATAARIQAALGSTPWSHWAPLFAEADCCVDPVLTYAEVEAQAPGDGGGGGGEKQR